VDLSRCRLLVGVFGVLGLLMTACGVETAAFEPTTVPSESGTSPTPTVAATADPDRRLEPRAVGDATAGTRTPTSAVVAPADVGEEPPPELGFVIGTDDSARAGDNDEAPTATAPAAPGGQGLQESATLRPSGDRTGSSGTRYSSGTLRTEADLLMTDAERASHGALLIEAFGLPGGRLISDTVRGCVYKEFVMAAAPLRADQLVAAMPVATADVALVVAAIDECGGLTELAELLSVELAQGLGPLFDSSISSCIAGFYAESDQLTDLLIGSIAAEPATDNASAADLTPDGLDTQATMGALGRCLGLGDVLAADSALIDVDEQLCLNAQGADVMSDLLNVEVRSAQVSVDPGRVTEALITCLPEDDRLALGG